MAYTRNTTFIIGVARLENSDCFQLLLISMSQNHDKFFDWLKTHSKTVQIYDAV